MLEEDPSLAAQFQARLDGEPNFAWVITSDLVGLQNTLSPQHSARELETLKGILQGKIPKVLASELGITDKTLYAHRANIMQKLQARSLAELQDQAMVLGLI